MIIATSMRFLEEIRQIKYRLKLLDGKFQGIIELAHISKKLSLTLK